MEVPPLKIINLAAGFLSAHNDGWTQKAAGEKLREAEKNPDTDEETKKYIKRILNEGKR